MKVIKYKIATKVNTGTVDDPVYIDLLSRVEMPYSESNMIIAKKEAYNGDITVEDDGTEETFEPTLNDRVQTLEETSAEMSEALNMILSGVTE